MIDKRKTRFELIANYRTDTRTLAERIEVMLAHREILLSNFQSFIAGTNGRSTIATLRELLQLRGLRVGTFTSPYIVSYNEQISINGQAISNQS